MSAQIPPVVCRLLPKLASTFDGEVVETARAMQRMLNAAGCDFHDLASAIEKPAEVREVVVYRERPLEPQPWRSSRYSNPDTTWADIAKWCQENDRGRLTPKERGFVNDIAARLVMNGRPTERQAEWLRAIYTKLKRTESAAA